MKIDVGKLIILLLLLIGFGLFYRFNLATVISIQTLHAHHEQLAQFVQLHYWLAVLAYTAIYTFLVLSTLPLAALFTIVGGFLFGFLPGLIYSNLAATAGAAASFLIFRYLIGASLQQRYAKQLAGFNQNMARFGISYMLIIHFVSIVPFSIINILAALTSLSLYNLVWTTFVGAVPILSLLTYMGVKLGEIQHVSELLSVPILIAFAVLVVLALLPLLWQYFKVRR